MSSRITRRHFLKTSALVGGAALLGSRRLLAATGGSANGDVRLAIVGVNGKGDGHISAFQKIPGVRVVALCDVDRQVLARRAKQNFTDHGENVATYTDYRKLLEAADVDAVVIATPDHWHALMTIWACQAGKDVYVEKPCSHDVWEGRQAVAAAAKYGRIVQGGTQSRSDPALQECAAYLRSGELGKIQWARALCYKPRESIGRVGGPQAVPAELDYDQWCGPAPLQPPRRNSPQYGPVHYDWHWFWDYGNGEIANQAIHQIDVARWLIGEPGLPRQVLSLGGRFAFDDDAQTPNTQLAWFDYASAPLIAEVRGLPQKTGMRAMDAYRGIRVGVIVQCEHGYLALGESGGGNAYDHNGRKLRALTSDGPWRHRSNFITAMRSRKTTDLAAPLAGAQVSTDLCILANISYRLGTGTADAAVREAVRQNRELDSSYAALLDHMRANGIDPASASTVRGPTLAPAAEGRLASAEKYDAGYWANTFLRTSYRAPYLVPETV